MTKNKKLGLILLIAPICLLILVLTGYAIASFVLSTAINSDTEAINAIGTTGLVQQSKTLATSQILNVIFGLLGLLAVLGIIVGIPLGIIFLAKKEPSEVVVNLTDPKYAGLSQEQLAYLSRWSWGAFFGSMIWALGNKLFLFAIPGLVNFALGIIVMVAGILSITSNFYIMLNFINAPIGLISLIILFYLAIKGRRLAWEKGWTSFDEFKNRQKVMTWIILAFYLVMIVAWVAIIYYGIQNLPPVEY